MKTDNEYMYELKALVDGPHNFLSNLARAKKYEELRHWIKQKTPFIPDNKFYTMGNRIFYLINGLTELPICTNPSCTNHVRKNFTVYTPKQKYYNCYCCLRCIQLDPTIKQKIETTNMQRHGMRRGNIKPDTINKRIHTCRKRFGADSPLESKEIRKKCQDTCFKRFGVYHPTQSNEIRLKIQETIKERYNVDNVFQSKDIQTKIKNTLLEKYDASCVMDIPSARKKMHDTMVERYGSSSFLGTSECKEKTKQFFMEKYGVEHPSQVDEIRKRTEQTNLSRYNHRCGVTFNSDKIKNIMKDKYGVFHISKSPVLRNKMKRHYYYDGKFFDSKPEIAFYIWLRDSKIPFEYQPSVSFEFIYNNDIHKYFPDFKINDIFFEIKGDHFFKINDFGKEVMINPYRNSSWTDEQYNQECEKYEAKHQCMLKNQIVILRKNEYFMFIEYVKENYGAHYIDQFKIIDTKYDV